MKFEIINRKFTETVADWMAKGWYINTASMRGSQGEIGKVDLTDGTEVIRVLLDNFREWGIRIEDKRYEFEGVKIVVGKVTDGTIPNSTDDWNTVWNEHLEIITEEIFYEIGDNRHGRKWYGTREEAITQQDKARARYAGRQIERVILIGARNPVDNKKVAEIAKAYVKRQPRCRSTKRRDIAAVKKVVDASCFDGTITVRYTIETTKGNTYRLH